MMYLCIVLTVTNRSLSLKAFAKHRFAINAIQNSKTSFIKDIVLHLSLQKQTLYEKIALIAGSVGDTIPQSPNHL